MDRRINAFLAIAETGSLTAAAQALNVTQPALTKTLRSLESDLGAPLLKRGARGSTLTAAGERLLSQATTMRRAWRSAREEIRALSSGQVERLRIGAGPAYHPQIVPELMCRLRREFPATRLEMDTGVNDSEMPRLIAGEIDLLLGAFNGPTPETIGRHPLLEIETVIFVRAGHPLGKNRIVKAGELGDALWLVYKKDDMVHARINAWLATAGCGEARIVVQVGALTSGFEIVAGSDLLISGPRQVEPLAKRYGLVPLRVADTIWRFQSGACFRQASLAYPIVRRSLELLDSICGNAAPMEAATGTGRSRRVRGR
jgi:DNA-binding transcriptional LysR family regulator